MIAYLITAALLADPFPKLDVVAKAPPKPVSAITPAEPDPILAGVAVTVECTARTDGRVASCEVLGESHPGLGFGDAAVALMTGIQTSPASQTRAFTRTIQFTP